MENTSTLRSCWKWYHLLVTLCLSMTSSITCSQDTCPVIRYSGSFDFMDHVKDHALVGSSYKNVTSLSVDQCFSVCVQDCRCVSYQLYGQQCELIDDNRQTVPADRFRPLSGYLYFELNQIFIKGPGCSSVCNNGCCRHSPCQHGGTCIELCDNVTRKFECKCPVLFTGRVCEYHLACKAYHTSLQSNIYPISTPTKGLLDVYCDFTSEPGMVWTLVESFSLSNNNKYRSKPLSQDYPVNENSLDWSDYRLSLYVMQYIKSHATHWRATCDYDKVGLNMTDYVRGRLVDMDIIKHRTSPSYGCYRVEYINVRGISCSDCTTHMRQDTMHIYLDSIARGNNNQICDSDMRQGSVIKSNNGCENFGYYMVVNPSHRCTANSSSTTQWWIGSAV